MAQVQVGEYIIPRRLQTLSASYVEIPSSQITHIQFRRFASCPICTTHILSFVERHLELVEQGVQEIVIFHSTEDEMRKRDTGVPFAMVADPKKELYKAFGVESSVFSLLHPRALSAGVKGLLKIKRLPFEKGQGVFGLPADILIAKSGEVVATKYGTHADDHWEVDDVIRMARQYVV